MNDWDRDIYDAACRRIDAAYPVELRVSNTLNIPKPPDIDLGFCIGSYPDHAACVRVFRFLTEADKEVFEAEILNC